MKRLSLLLAILLPGAFAQAQEQQFETVITPAFTPITWERLVNAADDRKTG